MTTDPFKFGRAYDLHELVADGIIHGIGVVFALVGATALIFYATVFSDYANIAASWIYGLGLIISLGVSFTYNMWPHSRVKWILRRFDHSAIFILIASTYTPFLVQGADRPLILALLIGIWITERRRRPLLQFGSPATLRRAPGRPLGHRVVAGKGRRYPPDRAASSDAAICQIGRNSRNGSSFDGRNPRRWCAAKRRWAMSAT